MLSRHFLQGNNTLRGLLCEEDEQETQKDQPSQALVTSMDKQSERSGESSYMSPRDSIIHGPGLERHFDRARNLQLEQPKKVPDDKRSEQAVTTIELLGLDNAGETEIDEPRVQNQKTGLLPPKSPQRKLSRRQPLSPRHDRMAVSKARRPSEITPQQIEAFAASRLKHSESQALVIYNPTNQNEQ